jgi:hypothetical protein
MRWHRTANWDRGGRVGVQALGVPFTRGRRCSHCGDGLAIEPATLLLGGGGMAEVGVGLEITIDSG